MNIPLRNSAVSALQPDRRLLRGLVLAVALSIAFMVATAYQSAATLMTRVGSTDVMRAASGGAWSGQIGREIGYFVFAQVVLHLALAAVTWTLALASAVIWPAARTKFGRTVVIWFCMLTIATITYNAFWFPRTGLGAYYHDAVTASIGPLAVGQIAYFSVVAAALLTVCLAVWTFIAQSSPAGRHRLIAACLPVAALGLVSALWAGDRSIGSSGVGQQRPHVILLGIDSLRLDQLQRYGGVGVTQNLDHFLAQADIVRDTTTPAARTFSSWVAILTGRSPPLTGARFNLANRTSVAINPTIADVLRGAGYHTVYSTDEVRFANIDESYGFDQVITPPIGASDFLIGTYNELPLASVVVNTWLGQVLFPFSYGNRGVATLFQPESYLSRLDHELSFDQPTLLITHLTASHWPYYVSDTPFGVTEKKYAEDRPLYRIGLKTADSMFGDIVAMLERKGALQNALVVVLSDHGEALSLPSDTIFKSRSVISGLRAPLKTIDFGHGQSVLSPIQYQVLLGFRTFGVATGFDADGRDLAGSATVEDIAPTILDLLRLPGNALAVSGESFAAVLRREPGADRIGQPGRIRFTETDLRVLPDPDGGVDEVATARSNSMFFEVDAATARLHIRDRYAPLALAFKERAAYDENQLLAALPAGPDAHQYLLFDLATGNGRLLLTRPVEPEAAGASRLWDAIWANYPGELKPPVSVTQEDWPRIDKSWQDFFLTRDARASELHSNATSTPKSPVDSASGKDGST